MEAQTCRSCLSKQMRCMPKVGGCNSTVVLATSCRVAEPSIILILSLHLVVFVAERPREHAVDAEVFAELAQCGLAMIKRGQAVNEVRG